MTPAMPPLEDRFLWHPEARLYDGAGREILPGAGFSARIAERPGATALAAALAGQGRVFRIGGSGTAPAPASEPGAPPLFETLTGGTSGTPRRIRRSQASWIASFAVNAGLFGIGPGMAAAVLGRLVHSLALYGAFETLHLGGTLHLLDGMRPDRQRAALARRDIALLYATPAQLRLMVEMAGPILPLRHLLVGGSKLDAALRAAVQAMAPGAAIQEFYGAAEASFITLAGPDAPEGSVGRPYPGVNLAIRDAGRDLPEGRTGEVWVTSPYLFRDYAGRPGQARREGGWLTVGELGRLQDGHLFLAGRAGRMVKIADQAVHPEEIEAFLLAQPGVARAAVLPRPDPRRGQHLVAFVQGEAADAVLLAALCQAFGPLVAPKAILHPADWPTLASGKTDLVRLSEAT